MLLKFCILKHFPHTHDVFQHPLLFPTSRKKEKFLCCIDSFGEEVTFDGTKDEFSTVYRHILCYRAANTAVIWSSFRCKIWEMYTKSSIHSHSFLNFFMFTSMIKPCPWELESVGLTLSGVGLIKKYLFCITIIQHFQLRRFTAFKSVLATSVNIHGDKLEGAFC